MGKLLEAFKIVCNDFDDILEKRGKLFKARGDIIQGRILIKEIIFLMTRSVLSITFEWLKILCDPRLNFDIKS